MRLPTPCVLAIVAGCGSDAVVVDPPPVDPPPSTCGPHELETDAGCLAVGVPPEACGEGMEPSEAGCRPVLPAEPCPMGTMALPGETTCQPVAPCGEEPYAGIPVDAGTIYVDAAASTGGDGTIQSPFPTLAFAIQAAAPGTLVAIAPGTYDAAVVSGKPLRLWGRCPRDVELISPGPSQVALQVYGSSGFEAHNLSFGGTGVGFAVTSEDAHLEGIWFREGLQAAVLAYDDFGPSSLTVRRALVEPPTFQGIAATGSVVSLEEVVMRGPSRTDLGIPGIVGFPSAPPTVALRRALLSGFSGSSIAVTGEATLEDVVVLDTAAFEGRGHGLEARNDGCRPFEVRRSHFGGHVGVAIVVDGAAVTVEHTTIRGVVAGPSGRGHGLVVQADGQPACGASSVTASEVSGAVGAGVVAIDRDLAIADSVIRDMAPRPTDMLAGTAVSAVSTSGHTLDLTNVIALRTVGSAVLSGGSATTMAGV